MIDNLDQPPKNSLDELPVPADRFGPGQDEDLYDLQVPGNLDPERRVIIAL